VSTKEKFVNAYPNCLILINPLNKGNIIQLYIMSLCFMPLKKIIQLFLFFVIVAAVIVVVVVLLLLFLLLL